MNVLNTDVSFAGIIDNVDVDAYNFFTGINIPGSTTPCTISDSNTFVLQPPKAKS